MVLLGHSIVPVVIVFVKWHIIYKICVNNIKYVDDITAVIAECFPFSPFSLTSCDAYVTIVILGFRDILMEISVGIYTDLKCDK